MADVYHMLGEQDKGGEPYVLDYQKKGQALVFFGANHSNDLTYTTQWSAFDAAWTTFLEQPGQKVLIHENQLAKLEADSRESAILANGEIGLAMWSAQAAHVESISGEPGRTEELTYLKEQFPEPEIMTYYFGRQMYQWLKQDFRTESDWRTYAEHCIERYATIEGWQEKPSLPSALRWYQQVTGKQFDPQDEKTLYKISDPSVTRASSASGNFRDTRLLRLITANWQAGKNIFAIYGSGHAIVLEPALQTLTANTSNSNVNTDISTQNQGEA